MLNFAGTIKRFHNLYPEYSTNFSLGIKYPSCSVIQVNMTKKYRNTNITVLSKIQGGKLFTVKALNTF